MWLAIGLALVLCGGAGLFLGAYRAAQDPAFYAGVIRFFVAEVLPEILASSPETQAANQKRIREGRERGKDR